MGLWVPEPPTPSPIISLATCRTPHTALGTPAPKTIWPVPCSTIPATSHFLLFLVLMIFKTLLHFYELETFLTLFELSYLFKNKWFGVESQGSLEWMCKG